MVLRSNLLRIHRLVDFFSLKLQIINVEGDDRKHLNDYHKHLNFTKKMVNGDKMVNPTVIRNNSIDICFKLSWKKKLGKEESFQAPFFVEGM